MQPLRIRHKVLLPLEVVKRIKSFLNQELIGDKMGDTKTLDYLVEREKARRIVNLSESRRNSVANNDMLIDYYQRQKNKELYGTEHPQIDPEKVREFLENCEHERLMEACMDGKLSEYYAEKRKKEQKLERLKKLINDGGLYTML